MLRAAPHYYTHFFFESTEAALDSASLRNERERNQLERIPLYSAVFVAPRIHAML